MFSYIQYFPLTHKYGMMKITDKIDINDSFFEIANLKNNCIIFIHNFEKIRRFISQDCFECKCQAPISNQLQQDFPCGAVDKNLPPNARDVSSIPGPGRFHKPWTN